MKTYLKFLACLVALLTLASASAQTVGLNGKISSAEPKTNNFLLITLATTNATALVSTNLYITTVSFYGFKSITNNGAPTVNGSSAYIGWNDVDGRLGTAGTPVFSETLAAGAKVTFNTTGTKMNLKDAFVTGTTADKVLVVYQQ